MGEDAYAMPHASGMKVTFEPVQANPRQTEGQTPGSIVCCELCGTPRFHPENKDVEASPLRHRFGLWLCMSDDCYQQARLRAFKLWVHVHAKEAKAKIGVPPLYLELYDSPVNNVFKRVQYVDPLGFHPGVYVYGPTGTGKTTLLSAWLDGVLPLAVSKHGLSARWVMGSDLLEELKGSFEKHRTEEVFQKFCSVKLLCIDDFGTEYLTDWARATFYRLIEKRLQVLHFTAVTSTLSPQDVAAFDARLASRFLLFQQVLSRPVDLRDAKVTRQHIGNLVLKELQGSDPLVFAESGSPSSMVTGTGKVGR